MIISGADSRPPIVLVPQTGCGGSQGRSDKKQTAERLGRALAGPSVRRIYRGQLVVAIWGRLPSVTMKSCFLPPRKTMKVTFDWGANSAILFSK